MSLAAHRNARERLRAKEGDMNRDEIQGRAGRGRDRAKDRAGGPLSAPDGGGGGAGERAGGAGRGGWGGAKSKEKEGREDSAAPPDDRKRGARGARAYATPRSSFLSTFP